MSSVGHGAGNYVPGIIHVFLTDANCSCFTEKFESYLLHIIRARAVIVMNEHVSARDLRAVYARLITQCTSAAAAAVRVIIFYDRIHTRLPGVYTGFLGPVAIFSAYIGAFIAARGALDLYNILLFKIRNYFYISVLIFFFFFFFPSLYSGK